MKSPFPGMDPYLESHWGDVCLSLNVYISDTIQPQLPDDLVARIHYFRPDDEFADDEDEQPRERIIRIHDRRQRDITSILIVCPWQKVRDEAVRQFKARRRQELQGVAHLMEIDLVRTGGNVLVDRDLPETARTPYRVMITHTVDHRVDLRPLSMSTRLPTVPVPLRPEDPPVRFDLQEMFDKAYENGRYDITDYTRDCDPPLEGTDAKWADALLRQAGKR